MTNPHGQEKATADKQSPNRTKHHAQSEEGPGNFQRAEPNKASPVRPPHTHQCRLIIPFSHTHTLAWAQFPPPIGRLNRHNSGQSWRPSPRIPALAGCHALVHHHEATSPRDEGAHPPQVPPGKSIVMTGGPNGGSGGARVPVETDFWDRELHDLCSIVTCDS